LENEFAAMQKPFEVCQFASLCTSSWFFNTAQGKETEHNWAARERGIQRVRGMLKGEVHNRYSEQFSNSLKDGFIQWSLKSVFMIRSLFPF
jgi:CLIP-associating protein 1/2